MRFAFILIIFLFLTPGRGSAAQLTARDSTELLAYGKALLLAEMGLESPPTPPACATQKQRACFVTFFANKQVIACFGSFTPRKASLAEEIAANIRLAIKNDRRALKITPELARSCDLQITFPGPPVRISDWRNISPLSEGLLVELADGHGVAIVPGEAKTAEYAWRSALKRLGTNPENSSVRISRFSGEIISTRHNLKLP